MISAARLSRRLHDFDIIDATYYMPADPARARADFQALRIPGARLFEIDEIVDRSSDLPHMLPDAGTFARAAAELGIDGSRPVAVYDRSVNHFSAPRVWLTLKLFGIENCYVLDGGFSAWMNAGCPVVSGDAGDRTVAPRTWTLDKGRVLTGAEMAKAVAAGDGTIFDARSKERFAGAAAEPRPGLRSGHMQGASCVPFTSLTRSDGLFVDPSTLRTMFGYPTDREPIVSCGSGLTACVLALGLARLGLNARLYDGSWSEWGRGALGDIITDAV
ncbi:sulfurtransferase [Bradyrhizobium sp. Ce-3]|uniref:sulfurtransferase n=1 Tax=Bradyrhizobium sp. Ce-3 TaxID=2913970 RepID=UPI001FC87861|nr:sulfurtransferase [Bradyrhizobium sp. Ce-3]